MAKNRAPKKFKFGPDFPLPPAATTGADRYKIHPREVLENAPSTRMTNANQASRPWPSTMSPAKAHLILTGSDEFQVRLPEGVPTLDCPPKS